jgi:hypothetical protein
MEQVADEWKREEHDQFLLYNITQQQQSQVN